mmetsp:Transcript_11051/g.27962  ORF Transcript_11051/g.27962 Transcript_11051/m.27962 type:complete len:216 (-) Transcript_11051:423-1070(-)
MCGKSAFAMSSLSIVSDSTMTVSARAEASTAQRHTMAAIAARRCILSIIFPPLSFCQNVQISENRNAQSERALTCALPWHLHFTPPSFPRAPACRSTSTSTSTTRSSFPSKLSGPSCRLVWPSRRARNQSPLRRLHRYPSRSRSTSKSTSCRSRTSGLGCARPASWSPCRWWAACAWTRWRPCRSHARSPLARSLRPPRRPRWGARGSSGEAWGS